MSSAAPRDECRSPEKVEFVHDIQAVNRGGRMPRPPRGSASWGRAARRRGRPGLPKATSEASLASKPARRVARSVALPRHSGRMRLQLL